MEGWKFYLRFTHGRNWNCCSDIMVLFARRCQQGFRSSPPVWWDKRLQKEAALTPCPSQLPNGFRVHFFSSVGLCGPGSDLKILCEQGQLGKALDTLQHMDEQGIVPTVGMYVHLLRACAKEKALAQARQVHADLARHRMDSIRFLGETVVHTMVKCGNLEEALEVFHRLPQRTSFSWTIVISGLRDAGRSQEALKMYYSMREEGIEPDKYTFVSLLRACSTISQVKSVHSELLMYGCESDSYVGTSLVNMYAKCGSILDAQYVFRGLLRRDVVSWTAMLTAYIDQGQANKVLELYGEMQEQGISPDAWIIVSALQACSMLAETEDNDRKASMLKMGKAVHAEAWRRRYESDIFVGNALITVYGKCGSVADARNAFQRLSKRDTASWNAMLAGYAQLELGEQAFQLYEQMTELGVSTDDRTFVSALQACAVLAEEEDFKLVDGQLLRVESWERGKEIHALLITRNYVLDIFLGSALVTVYGKSGSIFDARNVFEGLASRDIPVWNAILAAYVLQGEGEQALQLYRQMQEEGATPDDITLTCVLQACSVTGNLVICTQIHHYVVSSGNKLNLLLANTLIHTYGKCASMGEALKVFDSLSQPSVVSWNALIAGYAREGNYAASFRCYEELLLRGAKPNRVTFLAIISACSHAGLVDSGIDYFESMSRDHTVSPDIDHYVTMTDLLGRAGDFTGLQRLLSKMPMAPNLSLWLCLLGACQKHGKVELGKRAFDCAIQAQPKSSAAYVMMSNIYAQAGLWDEAHEVNSLRQKAGAWKKPGQSWMGFEQEVEAFMVGDCKQTQQEEVYDLLGKVSFYLKIPPAQRLISDTGERAFS